MQYSCFLKSKQLQWISNDSVHIHYTCAVWFLSAHRRVTNGCRNEASPDKMSASMVPTLNPHRTLQHCMHTVRLQSVLVDNRQETIKTFRGASFHGELLQNAHARVRTHTHARARARTRARAHTHTHTHTHEHISSLPPQPPPPPPPSPHAL